MSRGKLPPAAIEEEQSLLGAILLRPIIVHDLKGTLDPIDFYSPKNQYVYLACLRLHEGGQPIDAVTVADELEKGGVLDNVGGVEYLNELMAATPSSSAFASYADVVIETSRRRRLMLALAELGEKCYERGSDIDELLKTTEGIGADRLIAPRTMDISGLYSVADFAEMAKAQEVSRPWLIPHVIKPLWRVMLVAGEGIGKAVLMRFLAAHIAAGRDPWMPSSFVEPQRVLYIDTENPVETIDHQVRISNRGIDLIHEGRDNFFIWHREGGMNIRDRRPQAELEAVLQKVQPAIVFAGPLYKLYRRGPREDMEQAALEFTEVLDDLRVRYGFALMLEHHSPKGAQGAYRELNPFGSSLFLRWPEIGLTLDFQPESDPNSNHYTLDIKRFRRDRVINDWPQSIERSPHHQMAWYPSWSRGRGTRLTDV